MQKTQQEELKFTIQLLHLFFSVSIWQNISMFLITAVTFSWHAQSNQSFNGLNSV